MAKKMGIEIKEKGMTSDDFLSYIKAVYEYNQKNNTDIGAIYEAFDFRTTGKYLFQHLFVSELKDHDKVFSDNLKDEKKVALKKVLKYFEQLSQFEPLGEGYDTNQWFDTRNLVLEDKYLFYINGSWMYSHWNGLNPDLVSKMVPAELPVFNEIDHYHGGYIPTWAVFKKAPNKFNAIDLLLSICTEENADKWIQYAKTPTGLKSTIESSESSPDMYKEFNQYILNKYNGNIYKTENTKYVFGSNANVTSHFLYELIVKILTGQNTADYANSLLNANGN